MKILYHFPNPTTLSAGRTIANGYKNAFKALGHEFKYLTARDDQEQLLLQYEPDIFFTALSPLNLRFLNLSMVKKAKKNGAKIFVNIPFWKSPLSKFRINETASLEKNKEYISLLQSVHYGDIYFNMCEQGDLRMEGFEKAIGKKHQTVLLAADQTMLYPEKDLRFQADISYIGTNLPEKKQFFQEVIYPLRKHYDIRIYGQDWTTLDKSLGYLQKAGEYFNIPYLRSIRKPKLDLSDERKIYSSSLISINVHEEYQKQYGDLNERTFKIPLAGGFEIVDEIFSLKQYFQVGKEIIVAQNKDDWLEKIKYYTDNPQKRHSIIKAGREKVLQSHTYHNRVKQFLDLYQSVV